MGAVNYIDWTPNINGLFIISIEKDSYYVCDKIITLSDDYYYYESHQGNYWGYYPFVILDDSLLNDTIDVDILSDDYHKHSLSICRDGKVPIIGYYLDNQYTELVTSGPNNINLYSIGIFFNKYKVGCILPNHEVIVADIPNTFDTDTDKRIFISNKNNPYNDSIIIYTSDSYFTLKQNLVDAGYTNVVPLYDYLKGTYVPSGGSSSSTNKVNILKIY